MVIKAKNYNAKGVNIGDYEIDSFDWIGELGLTFEFSPSGLGKICDPDDPPTVPSVTASLHIYSEEDNSEVYQQAVTLTFSTQTSSTINIKDDLCDRVFAMSPNSLAQFYLDVTTLPAGMLLF